MLISYAQKKLESYAKKYLKRHATVRLVTISGSTGKANTKLAVSTLLSERYRVRMHETTYGPELGAPLAILGIELPENTKSFWQWNAVFAAARKRIKAQTDVDVIVHELATDGPGRVQRFYSYATPDIGVVTAVSPESMHAFHTIDAVAAEELSLANFSKQALINRDDIDGSHAQFLTNGNINTYGNTEAAEYYFVEEDFTLEAGYKGVFVARDWEESVPVRFNLVGEQGVRTAVAAGAVAVKLGLSPDEIARGFAKLTAEKGRMKVLRGVNGSTLIDDSFSSNPLSAASAIRTLYSITAPQRIAVFGSMSGLDVGSPEEHKKIGEMCDPNQLAHVITVGEQANNFLAPAAKANGCHVVSLNNAIEVGSYVHRYIEPGAAVLFNGSQDGIYLEEAIKVVLHSTEEEAHLVRQSAGWLEGKRRFFASFEQVSSVE